MLKNLRWVGLVITCFALCAPFPVAQAASKDLLQPAPPAEIRNAVRALHGLEDKSLSREELHAAVEASLAYAQRWQAEEVAADGGGLPVTWGRTVASLKRLREVLPRLEAEPELLSKQFQWYAMSPDPRFTAYYSPVFPASLEPTSDFPYPLYRLPEEIAPHLAACLPTHSCPDEAFSPPIVADPPLFTRSAIDLDKALGGRGLEMAWLAHPAEIYHLMLEGSGILSFPDGSKRAVLFAGLNGHKGRGLAGTLMRKHHLPARETSHEGIRRWWDANPSHRRSLLEEVTSYVFFRFGPPAPQGSLGSALTPWVSVAVDPRVVPLGSLVVYAIAPEGRKGAKRYGLGLAQDTGLGIKGRRVDMYTGEGAYARTSADRINHPGDLWVLLAPEE